MQELIEKIDFEKGDGLVPAVIQDVRTGVVLMLGYMNAEAITKTVETKQVTFFSRTKNRLWTKGETSGNFLELKSIQLDCDNDSLLVKVKPVGEVCHKGYDTCWQDQNKEQFSFIYDLEKVVQDRKANPSEKSYTTSLLNRGINKVAQKVGEEAVELVIESKDDNEELFRNEFADLLYHLTVLLAAKDFTWQQMIDTLKERH